MRDDTHLNLIASRRFQREAEDEGRRSPEVGRQLRADERPTLVDRDAVADRTLAEANERLAVADRAIAEADARLRAATGAKREDTRAGLQARLEEHAAALYEGDIDKATLALAAVIEPLVQDRAPSIDLKAVKRDLKRDLKLEEQLETFAERYPEIVKDDFLAATADGYYEAARAQGRSDAESLSLAGESTRAYVKTLGQKLGMHERGARGPREERGEELDARGVIADMAASRPGAIVAQMRERLANGE